ncbi:MAG: hypothetical protein QM535_11180 [Limnohabitans sp.]|nr:hypothetical protein [Limnohabitans sp.]
MNNGAYEFLKKIKVIDFLTISLSVKKSDFVKSFEDIVENASIGFFSDPFDPFIRSDKEYKGTVYDSGFEIKKRKRFFDNNFNIAVASGSFIEKDGELIIETEINGFSKFFIFYYSFLILGYSAGVIGLLNSENEISFIAVPFLLIHAFFMFAFPYFIVRKSVQKLKYELEREFFYLTK